MVFNLADILSVAFTLFAVIDVIGGLPVMISLKSRNIKIKPATTTLAAGFLMILFALVGEKLLGLMGVDVPSFAIAGSIVIFILGIELVLGINIFKSEDDIGNTGSIVPLAFPLLAGSGTLTTIISLTSVYSIPNVLIGIIINLIIIFIVLFSVDFLERRIGKAVLAAMKKFFGVVLIAIAVRIFMSAIMAKIHI